MTVRPREEASSSGVTGISREAARVLLVDDRPENLLALDAILSSEGHRLVRAQSGEEALKALLDDDFAVVLLDMRMPGLDGLQTARAIKARARSRHTPIIFLTANDSPGEIAEAYEHGAVDFLTKPFNPTVLRAKVAVFAELFEQRRKLNEHELQRRLLEGREQELRERNHLLALDAEVGLALGRAGTLAAALEAVADALVRHLDAAFARIWTLSADGAFLELKASAGIYTHLDGAHGRVPVGQFKIGKIASERRAHVTNQVVGDARVVDQEWAVREKIVAFAGYPLVVADRLVGVVAAFARHPLSPGALSSMGSIAGITGQSVERRRAEDAVRASQGWLSTTLTSIGDGVIVTDSKGCVSFLNPVAETLTGWTSAEATGKHLDEIFHTVSEATRSKVDGPVAKVLRDGAVVGMVHHTLLVRRDGSEIVIDDSAAPILDGTNLTGVVLVFRDASDKRRVEVERERLLKEAQESRERAELASRAQDEFLATASHELRTPLNSILGWSQMLRSGQLDPSGFFRAAEIIERNAKAQVQLIEDILDGSRMITGKLHLETRPLDLIVLVNAALDTVRPAIDAKELELVVSLDANAARVVADPERLQQVIWNLVNNAIKFTPKGGRVEVRLERAGTSIHLVVKDSGQGIDADFLPHVFERFRQAEGTLTRRHGGLGLGLALVSHLVEAHGGTIRAESEGVGRGATFTVVLPVPAVHAEGTTPERPASTTSSGVVSPRVPKSLSGVAILVVDDERDASDLVATVLRAEGAEVLTAGNADEAIAILGKTTPMLLISDVGMPGVDGYELMRRVRTRMGRHGAQLPAIALTAYSREQDRRLALEAGFQTHVAKPVEPAELLRVVMGLLQFMDGESSRRDRDLALGRADIFLKFEKLLAAQGVHEGLRFLNSRTPHRFTGIYRFDPPTLRNVHLVDSYTVECTKGDDVPMTETFCSVVGEGERTFTTENSLADERLTTHPARETVLSYCGVLLRDAAGRPFGSLCHFDVVPCDVPIAEIPLMEAAAASLMRALRR